MRRRLALSCSVPVAVLAPSSRRRSPPRAAGLVGENGTIQLVRTTTLAAYHDGVERYVTSFEFTGEGESVGSIVPLPDVPTQRRARRRLDPAAPGRGGRARRRTATPARPTTTCRRRRPTSRSSWRPRSTPSTSPSSPAGATRSAGGPSTTGSSCRPTRPRCSTSTPSAARCSWPPSSTPSGRRDLGQGAGDSTPIMATIPTDDPWVPVRILGLGLEAERRVEADVFLLTDEQPELLAGGPGLSVERSEPASPGLLADLRSDVGMEWVPGDMWLSYLQLDADAGDLDYDLAVARRRSRRAVDRRRRRRTGGSRAGPTACPADPVVADRRRSRCRRRRARRHDPGRPRARSAGRRRERRRPGRRRPSSSLPPSSAAVTSSSPRRRSRNRSTRLGPEPVTVVIDVEHTRFDRTTSSSRSAPRSASCSATMTPSVTS